MTLRVTLEGRKPPVWEISGDTLADFQETLNEVGINFTLLLNESEGVARFQGTKQSSSKAAPSGSGSGALRTAPAVPVGDASGDIELPIPDDTPDADSDPSGEEGTGTSGPRCADCGEVMDLSPKNAKRIYGREDICSDCGDLAK